MTTPREMSAQCEWADLAIEDGKMSESQAFSWLCQQWGIDEDEALAELNSTSIYGLLGYASYPDTSFIQSLGPDDDGSTAYAFSQLEQYANDYWTK